MVARYGMCERLGTVSYLDGGEVFIGRDYQSTKSYSEKAAAAIDDEVKILIDKAYQHCKELLSNDKEAFDRVVAFLMEHESMSGEQLAACMVGKTVENGSDTALFDNFANTEE